MNFVSIKHAILSIFLLTAFLCPINGACQVSIDKNRKHPGALERISAYGKLWGIINYFHPAMGKGGLDGDSLFLKNIRPLVSDPSAIAFRESVKGMLAELNDSKSILINMKQEKFSIHPAARKSAAQSILPDKLLYLALPQTAFNKPLNADSTLSSIKLKKIIIDLRCTELDHDLGIKQYKSFVQPLIASMLKSDMLLPTERSFFYKGLMRQDFPQDLNLFDADQNGNLDHLQVHQGLKNISEGAYVIAEKSKAYSFFKYCFIVNRFTNVNTVKAIMALRRRGGCFIIFDGPIPDYTSGTFYYQTLPDELIAKVRVSEVIYEDGTLGQKPDFVYEQQSDTALASIVIQRAAKMLKEKPTTATLASENMVMIRKPIIPGANTGTPKADQRLLALFNFWNAIHFFSPNKNLISIDWDAVLPQFVGKFLAADSEQAYFLSLMELTASIKDGHGILLNTKTGRSPKGFMDGNLPFACEEIDKKIYITSIMPDSLQQKSLSGLHYGDELIAIDGLNVDAIIKKWEPLLVASNQAGFKRELFATWLTAGAIGSRAKITILSKGIQSTVTMNRIDRNDYYMLWGKVIRPGTTSPLFPPNWSILAGNIGYIRMNRLYSKELDRVASALKNCENIIIDARGYPRDGTIGTNLAAYIAKKADTVCYDLFPFLSSPELKKRQMLIDYSVIEPKLNQDLKQARYFVLVDEGVQSQGEWNVIAIQGVTKAVTIGRQTAGANGMAVTISLPGNYLTFFSGFGEYYMDHTPNQKNGVRLDLKVEKTLQGAINGTDDILEKALQLILKR